MKVNFRSYNSMEEDIEEKTQGVGPARYALLLAAHDSEYVKKVYGGYFNVFVSALGEQGETWDLYRVVEGEFPGMDELENYDGFVVSGSPFDAYANDLWILRLCLLLQTLYAMHKRVLGICFGHQVLCRALGGKVTKSPTGWDIGLRELRLSDQGLSILEGYSDDNEIIPNSLSIIECHQDEVWEVPMEAQVLAFSDKTRVEMFSVDNHILGIQGHPEYSKDILLSLIDRLLTNGSIEEDFAEVVKLTLETAEPDRKYWEIICKNFLKGRQSLSNYGLDMLS